MQFPGIFPLIGAIANCSSYQNPRRKDCGNLIGLFKTGTAAEKADVDKICKLSCFMLISLGGM
jgi:hypothetical protein